MNATCLDDINHAAGIDLALKKGFHRMVARDVAREGQAMLDARPSCQFEGLEAGKSYCYKPSYGQPCLVVVGQTTPKCRQATVSVNCGAPRRIYRGNYPGRFIELDADLLVLSSVSHEEIVKAAVAAGLEVPPEVRRQYPALFVTIPERFANGHHSAVERVTQSLATAFRKEPINVEDVDGWIDEAHKQIASLRCERTRMVALNPDTAPDYDRYIVDHRADIDFYRWLRKLVDLDGVFHV